MSKLPKPAQDNRANQLNPNNPAYQSSRSLSGPGHAATTAATPHDPRKAQPAEQPLQQGSKKP